MEGDIIYVVRKPLGLKSFNPRRSSRSGKLDQLIARTLLYRHYGIEVEDGNVIHFICDSILYTNEGTIKKTTMDDFLKDGEKKIDTEMYHKFSRERVVKRAYSRLNTPFDGYKIYTNNCEHFAAWCANGSKVSKQAYFAKSGQTLVKFPKKAKDKLVSVMAIF
ncbi:MAG: hypothetical protein CVU84_05655 [Firmicutes bacterium HGW-Firmicutes-1]|jgi:hypothetical protein|nr:MAG: hypothetical protein CVU84_05655 [Firmicutes bacterium HGW-Firmicutes-1]